MTCFDDARERRTGRNGSFPQILDYLLSLGKKCFLTTADTRKQESQFPFETGQAVLPSLHVFCDLMVVMDFPKLHVMCSKDPQPLLWGTSCQCCSGEMPLAGLVVLCWMESPAFTFTATHFQLHLNLF